MKKVVSFMLLIATLMFTLSCVRALNASPNSPAAATISIVPSLSKGTVSPYIFGVGVEWAEHGNGILDPVTGKLRADVIEALKPLHLSVIRFPGGIMADYYHWQDGVGSINSRPARPNPMNGELYENSFGTEEYIELCQELGSTALITANAGTGSLEELLAWQQFFKDKGFPVRFWEIGNEIYLSEPSQVSSIPGNDIRIYQTPGQYAEKYNTWAKALRKEDDSVLVGAIAGTTNTSKENTTWLSTILQGCSAEIDFLALHNAFSPLIIGDYDYENEQKRNSAYLAMLAFPQQQEKDTLFVLSEMESAKTRPPARLAITEHFPLFGAGRNKQEVLYLLDQSKTLASGLYTAGLMHSFMRSNLWMANFNLILSKWFGALLLDTPQGLVRTPAYYVYDMYRNVFGNQLVQVDTAGPIYSIAELGVVSANDKVPVLDAVAAKDSSNRLTLAVLNRSPQLSISTKVVIQGVNASSPVETWTLSGNTLNSINGKSLTQSTVSGENELVRVNKGLWENTSTEYEFPPHSVTILRWAKEFNASVEAIPKIMNMSTTE